MKLIRYFSKRVFTPVSTVFAGLYLCISMSGCQWGDEVVALKQQNPDDFMVLFSDTSLVKLTTVAMDSVMTGSSSRMLVGRYVDPYFGKMQAAAFFQPAFVSALGIPDLAVYDSLVFKVPYDKYYYGDTTKVSNFSLYPLTQDITLTSSFSNFSTTPFDATPLGKKSFAPTPTSVTQAVRFKLSDVLGKKIFDLSVANLLTSNEQWLEVLKGLVLMSDAKDNGSVVGFQSFSDSTVIELHYHTEQQDGVTRGVGTFKVQAEYNQILGDRSATNLAKLPLLNSRNSLPSEQSGNQGYIQGGTGIMLRADFPTVRNLKYVQYSVPNRAFLRVTPLQRSMEYPYAPPQTLHVFLVDKFNQFYRSGGFPIGLSDLASKVVTGTFINDMINNKQYYLFDVSGQFTTILASASEETNGLMFVTSALNGDQGRSSSFPELNSEFSKGLTRLVVGDQLHPSEPGVKLELYYTTYKAP
ncbi:DUF4270 family protein [Dyadobacter frigoris]|uniref:DUF4270 domain-containing protein n=1 Tax=Dyadobacter frigoris TaxID=2576211 RepID=A0A4U6D3J6_9BACT|nr:DUF4270 family protein [Dyadobacter frigoris]TKT90468.1 DUF4270 domain-containing protein [Dyadobacter frigoris]